MSEANRSEPKRTEANESEAAPTSAKPANLGKARQPRQPESSVVAAVLRYLGSYPGVTVWRNNTGRLRAVDGRAVSFGLKGSADVFGIAEPHGKFIAVECKSETGKITDQQQAFARMVLSRGGRYILARRVEDLYPWFPPVSP